MDRDRIARELSLHLDGRLPAARRDALLGALRDDPSVRQLLAEMRHAQELALGLPREVVGPTFSESLWQRIRAGEGSPEAMFREPVSLGTKLRYLAAGAAAAALTMLAMQPFRSDATAPRSPAGGEPAPRVAVEPATDADRVAALPLPSPGPRPHGGLRPRGSSGFGPELVALTPSNMARATQLGTYEAVHELRESAPTLERRVGAVAPRELVIDLEPQLERVRGLSDLLRWMQRENLATLPNDFDTALTIVERSVDRLERSARENAPRWLMLAVEDLKELDPQPLQRNFQVACCIEPGEFLPQVTQHFQTNPRALGAIRLVRADGFGLDRLGLRLEGPLHGLDPTTVMLWIDASVGGRDR